MGELSREASLQRVMRASGRVPVQCSCSICKQQCHTPCLGTPDDIERIIDAGYADRLELTNWATGIFRSYQCCSSNDSTCCWQRVLCFL